MGLHSTFSYQRESFSGFFRTSVIAPGTNFTSVCHLSSFWTLCPYGGGNNMATGVLMLFSHKKNG